jgi:hypothetical protein
MSFRQRAVTKFVVKEGNWTGVIYERLAETKRQSMEWNQTTLPKNKKQKTVPSAGKVMGTVFCDGKGRMLVDFLEKLETINAARYVQTLNMVRRALREKRPKKKTHHST